MRFYLACLFIIVFRPVLAANDSWSGTWDTRRRDGGARVELHQNGDKIKGVYESLNGIVEGTVSGSVLKGQWHQGSRSGGFDFVLAPDGRSFVGRYDSGEWWTGVRATTDPNAKDTVDLSTPRAASLGLNRNKARQAAAVTGSAPAADISLEAYAVLLRARLAIETVIVHTRDQAACGVRDGSSCACTVALCAQPRASTGAGDHFNAGYLFARCAGLCPPEALKFGTRIASSYVGSGISPTVHTCSTENLG